MGTPTLVCVWSCPNFSAPTGRPFRCVSDIWLLISGDAGSTTSQALHNYKIYTIRFTHNLNHTITQDNYNRDLILKRREERSLNNNSFLDEYECSSLALDKGERRDEKKRLDHLKQDQTMMVVKEIKDGLLEEMEAHGFALWPSCEDFPTGHPSQYYFHMSTLNCQFLGTPLAVDHKMRCVIGLIVLDEVCPTIPNGSGVALIPLVTPRLLRPQYCPQAHGFALWPSCEDFPAGHPSQYYFHMSTLNCQFLRTPLAVDHKTRCVIVRRMLSYEPNISPGHNRCGICLGCHRGDDFRVDVLRFHTCLTDILDFLEKFG
ncbi:hypothetical protein Tco_0351172 [Tanacetum coccineum]